MCHSNNTQRKIKMCLSCNVHQVYMVPCPPSENSRLNTADSKRQTLVCGSENSAWSSNTGKKNPTFKNKWPERFWVKGLSGELWLVWTGSFEILPAWLILRCIIVIDRFISPDGLLRPHQNRVTFVCTAIMDIFTLDLLWSEISLFVWQKIQYQPTTNKF